jgi:regulator of sigma E protease
VVVNLILGILIFIGINMFWGKKYLPTQNVSYGIYADSVAQTFGFRDGDKILAIDGKPVERLHEVRKNLFINEAKTVQVDRGGEKIDLSVAGKTAVLASYKGDFIAARFPFQISKIDVESPNKGADLRYNDQIIAVNGKNTPYYSDFGNEVKHWKDKEITATVLRKADTLMTTLKVTKEGKIGVFARPVDSLLTFETQTFGLGSAITTGVSDAFGTLGNQLSAFGMMFSGKVKATESLGGFASIGSMFGSTWDWHRFWLMTGVLSLILAFMNMLPIPMLDGGYAVFIVYEMITGKEPSEKFMNVAQTIGFVLILSLLIFSNGMDIYRWLTGKL